MNTNMFIIPHNELHPVLLKPLTYQQVFVLGAVCLELTDRCFARRSDGDFGVAPDARQSYSSPSPVAIVAVAYTAVHSSVVQ